jgi:hypothetical protein
MKTIKIILLLLVMAVVINSCKKDNDNQLSGNSITGIVRNENNAPVPDAEVAVDGKTTITNVNGEYTINNLSAASKYKITVNAQGYFTGYRNAENIDKSEIYADVMLIYKQSIGTVSGQSGGSASGNGIKYTIGTGAFNLNGAPYSGQVQVATRYIDASNMEQLSQTMPGGDFIATDASGNRGSLISFGFFGSEFTTPSGELLSVNPGAVRATITVPSSVPSPAAGNASAWFFNPTSGEWNSAGAVTNNGNDYDLPVSTLIFCNLDKFTSSAVVKGRVVDCDGKGIKGATVVIRRPEIEYKIRTNSNGYYNLTTISPADFVVTVLGETVNTALILPNTLYTVPEVKVGCLPPPTNLSLSQILIQNTNRVWLQNPDFLDYADYDAAKLKFLQNGIYEDLTDYDVNDAYVKAGSTTWAATSDNKNLILRYTKVINQGDSINPDYIDEVNRDTLRIASYSASQFNIKGIYSSVSGLEADYSSLSQFLYWK